MLCSNARLLISDLQSSQRSKPQPFEFQILGKFITLVIVLDCSVTEAF